MDNVGILTTGSKMQALYERFCQPVCKRYGLNQTALTVLLLVATHPEENTARDICRLWGIKSGIVSVTVETLVAQGYLCFTPDAADRRIKRLFPAPKSDALIADALETQKRFTGAVFGGLTARELSSYRAISKKLVDAVDALSKSEKLILE